MLHAAFTSRLRILAPAAVCLLHATLSYGVILHNDAQPADRPGDAVIGRWGTNGSCVAVAPEYVITTAHQGGDAGTAVVLGGVAYAIEGIVSHPTADLRVVKIRNTDGSPAALTDYAGLYGGRDEIGGQFVLGGFGKGRGGELQTGGLTYGYSWASEGNLTERWGTNKVKGALVHDGTYVLKTDFTGPSDAGATACEATPADYDSGGGWFFEVGGDWYVAALTRGAEHSGESWFRDSGNPTVPHADLSEAVRISSYADWIQQQIPNPPSVIPEPGTVSLLIVGLCGMLVRRRHKG